MRVVGLARSVRTCIVGRVGKDVGKDVASVAGLVWEGGEVEESLSPSPGYATDWAVSQPPGLLNAERAIG